MITRLALGCQDGVLSDGACFETLSLNNLAGFQTYNGAVGSPDDLVPNGPEGPAAHCDDADFLDIPFYPQPRWEATAKLQTCVDHLRMRFGQGIRGSDRMLDGNKIIPGEVDIVTLGPCRFFHRGTTHNTLGRAKCIALEGLGRALHGTEDFYSHSNWADRANSSRPTSLFNPPGLDRRDLAKFLDLRASNNISEMVPKHLTTGCFSLSELVPGSGPTGSFDCRDRIIHENMNKDHGEITQDGTIIPDPQDVPREGVTGNFARAVLSAIADARERWRNFQHELKSQYGAEKANLIICALTRDYPTKDCRNRKISIVIDSSGSNTWTDPNNLRIQAARDFNSKLVTAAQAGPDGFPDKVAVIDFDTTAKLLYPMGDPSGATGVFGAIDSNGGTNIGSGIALGIDEILKEGAGQFSKRSGIVVLTDGEDGSPANQVLQLARAKLQGNPSQLWHFDSVYNNFIDLVIARGATHVDSPIGITTLTSGVKITENITPEKKRHDFIYTASPGERLNFTLTVIRGTSGITGVLRNVRENVDIATMNATVGIPSTSAFDAVSSTELELIVSAPGNTTSEVIFSVGMGTNLADKNETTTSTPLPTPTGSNYTAAWNATATKTSWLNGTYPTNSLPKSEYLSGPYTVVTTVYCSTLPNKEETTVYDGPDTRTLMAYPISRITSVITTTIPQYVHTTCSTCTYGDGSYPAYPVSSAGYGRPTPPKQYEGASYNGYPGAIPPAQVQSSGVYTNKWNQTSGGGSSNIFQAPPWQYSAVKRYITQESENLKNLTGKFSPKRRATPDLSANAANFATVRNGTLRTIHGTSASAPLIASMITLINGNRLSIDIVTGSNSGCGSQAFRAAAGWDPVTGLGLWVHLTTREWKKSS
ncbi:hypothetical protein FB567DRAFT_621777 [Paraphoma chrysanthemicola]|uniref:VWFA domain-containing protein n=1 Tax=Paraphoma chrysanthemicola TaxID=798071 RepID=A0A8K0R989_9PLEO|nr:hypothetical protein FB567DRAFT_621777 [Paraphoma chrysanthemicola]